MEAVSNTATVVGVVDQEEVKEENDSENNVDYIDEAEENESIDFNDEEQDNWVAPSQANTDIDITLNLKNQSTITDQVISSLIEDNLSDEEIKIAEQIVGNLDEQGYLEIDSELIADRLNISNESVKEIIEKIKYSDNSP